MQNKPEDTKECHHEMQTNKPSIWLQKIQDTINNYKPLIIILIFCLILSFIQNNTQQHHSSSHYFMGYFFIFLAMFKFFDLKGFVEGFSTYDLLTMKFPFYGYIYPFIEFSLGISYLANFHPLITNVITIIVMTISGVAVLKSIASGQKIKCACLGTVLNVPLSTVSIIENFGMSVMAIYQLLLA